MISEDRGYVMVFNGEIYYHLVLKIELEKESKNIAPQNWRGHSDVEALLACF
jgi:asparagine synthase (glutamine-hydrolysing)